MTTWSDISLNSDEWGEWNTDSFPVAHVRAPGSLTGFAFAEGYLSYSGGSLPAVITAAAIPSGTFDPDDNHLILAAQWIDTDAKPLAATQVQVGTTGQLNAVGFAPSGAVGLFFSGLYPTSSS
jgi:hypothetical protein